MVFWGFCFFFIFWDFLGVLGFLLGENTCKGRELHQYTIGDSETEWAYLIVAPKSCQLANASTQRNAN